MKSKILLLALLSGQILIAQDELLVNEDNPSIEIRQELNESIKQDPINLNTCHEAELAALGHLSAQQINEILLHRETFGGFLSIYELQVIPSLDLTTINKIKHFITLKPKVSLKSIRKQLLGLDYGYVLMRLGRTISKQLGYHASGDEPPYYNGDPYKWYFKVRNSKRGQYSYALQMEKDAGELWTWNPSKRQFGADYISFHMMLEQIGMFDKILVGDYQIQTGQSLLTGGGFLTRKSNETIKSPYRLNQGIIPYSSSIESGFMRGVALQTKPKFGFSLLGYYSNQNLDGRNIQKTDNQTINTLSISESGFHRSISELNNRKTTNQQILGSQLIYKNYTKLMVGLQYQFVKYQFPIQPKPTLTNQFHFNGRHYHGFGLFAQTYLKNMLLYGEMAISGNLGKAAVLGCINSLSRQLDISLHFRYYEPQFQTILGQGFRENYTSNEQGMYWGMHYRFWKKWRLSGYIDVFRFPWSKFQSTGPSAGQEYLITLTPYVSRSIQFSMNYRNEAKERDQSEIIPVPQTETKESMNLLTKIQINDHLKFENRLAFHKSNQMAEGFGAIQNIIFEQPKWRLVGSCAIFDIVNTQHALYHFEKEVLWSYALNSYSGKGIKYYAILKLKPMGGLNIWLRYAITNYFDRTEISSGNDQINSNQKHSANFQVMYRF